MMDRREKFKYFLLNTLLQTSKILNNSKMTDNKCPTNKIHSLQTLLHSSVLFLFCGLKSCHDPSILSYHFRVVVKLFASGAEIPLVARVQITIGAEVGVTLTVLQMILSLRGLVNKGTYTVELLKKINNTNFFLKFLLFKPKHFASK